jgi:predicted DNA-binding protein with PD1-like motif
MIVFEARRTRRIVGRLERGESVLDALAELAVKREFTSAWFQAMGPLESAELAVYDAETQKHSLPRRVGASTAVQITGNLSRLGALPFAHAHALVVPARGEDGMHAGEPMAGELRAASSLAVEFVIEVFEDVVLDRMPDDATGLPLWRGRATAAVAASPAQLGWAAAAHEAERLEAERTAAEARAAAEAKAGMSRGGWGGDARDSRGREAQRPRRPQLPPERVVPQAFAAQPIPEKKRAATEEAEEPVLEPGDWVAHKQFGLCRVEGEDAEGALVIRLPSGVRKAIRLDFLRVLPAHEQDGRRVFPLEPRRR